MLRKTNQTTSDGRSIYVDQSGKKQTLPRVHFKSFSNSIPSWCWNFIQPIKEPKNHWNLETNRMELR